MLPTQYSALKATIIGVNLVAIAAITQPAFAQNSMASEVLAAHNQYRSEVGIEPLVWSETLAAHAQTWANYLAPLGGNR